MEINKKNLRMILIGAAACILLYWMLQTERIQSIWAAVTTVVSPFVVGAAAAFILNVPMRFIERHLKFIKHKGACRVISIVLTLIVVALVMTGVVYLLVPELVTTVESLIQTVPQFFNRVQVVVTEFLNDNPELLKWLQANTDIENLNWQDMIERAVSMLTSGVTTVVDTIKNTVVGLTTGIFNAVISFVFAMYCLTRKEILARQARRLVYSLAPEKVGDEIVRVMRMTSSSFANFISGQCLEAIILGALFLVCMLIFDMPYALLISVIIAVTALVPIVGAFAGCVIGAFLILMVDFQTAVWFVIMFLILQQLENNIIYPRVVGSSIGLPGMWVLVAVAIGGDLMGIGGMLIMIPLAAVVYALAREFTERRLAARGIPQEKVTDQPPELRVRMKRVKKKKKSPPVASEPKEEQNENT